VLIISLALVVVELVAIVLFFTNLKVQNISGNHGATCQQKLAVVFTSLNHLVLKDMRNLQLVVDLNVITRLIEKM
jgi:hypothetical protein